MSRFSRHKYSISYDFKHKALWFRVYKVATRTIDGHFKHNCDEGEYIFSSPVGYNPARYKDYFKFAFVRNPVDRFLSGWRNKVLGYNFFEFDGATHEEMKILENFVTWVEGYDMATINEHFRPQHLDIDLNNLDYLGRFETFSRDLAHISDVLGMKYDPALHLNSTPKPPEEINAETEKRIARLYKEDVRIFYPELISLLQ